MRLIVTGHDGEGKSIFSYAGAPPREASPGSYDLWSTKGPISMPDPTAADAPAQVGYFPAEGETVFKVVRVPGKSSTSPMADFSGQIPADIARHFDPDDPGMHTTDTIDYVLILSGEAELELDDGAKERVGAGDCVVQRGTRHAWRVTSDEPLVLVTTLIGADRR